MESTQARPGGGRGRILRIHQVSARTGHSPDRIRHLRVKGHELYDRAWKAGAAPNSPLLFDEADVDEWVATHKADTDQHG
ncbi:hypothetical protein OG203_34675 [Nocardia sp. NBC_01499]|uniref:hypothetical protein n=1 Tax=Nocardia sp. NBC_01499 TaxID=2903597 RepID=UPI003866B0D4